MWLSLHFSKESPRIWTGHMTYFERTVIKCDTSRDLKKHLHVSPSSAISIKHIWSSWKEKDTDQTWNPGISFKAILDQLNSQPILVPEREMTKQNTTDDRHMIEPSQDESSPEQFDHTDVELVSVYCQISLRFCGCILHSITVSIDNWHIPQTQIV